MRAVRNGVLCILFAAVIVSGNVVSLVDAQSNQIVETEEIGQIATPAWAGNVEVQGNIAFVSDMEGLSLFDISDPENPTELAYYNENVVEPHDMYVDENIVYLADYTDGLKIIDASDPSNLTQVGRFHDGGEVGTFDVSGDLVFIADFVDGIEIVNTSNPSQPTEIVQYDTDIAYAYNVEINDNLAFVSNYISQYENTLIILNISDLHSIEEIAEHPITGEAFSISFVGDIAYVASSYAGVRIFNISNPLDFVELGTHDDGGNAVEFEFYQDYLVVADRSDGLEILNINDLTNLTEVEQHYDGGSAAGVEIVDDLIFVADGDDGLEILRIDVTIPTTPTTPNESGTLLEAGLIVGALGVVVIVAVVLMMKRKASGGI
jgi:hypothetical protein